MTIAIDNGIIKPAEQPIEVISYRHFNSGDEVNDFFYFDDDKRGLLAKKNSKYGQWEKSLSPEAKTVIADYSTDGYDDINKYWRQIGDWKNIDERKVLYQTEKLDESIFAFALKDSIRTYRGISLDTVIAMFPDVEKLSDLVGKNYSDNAYVSTSPILNVAKKFVEQNGQDGIMLELEIPKGTGRGAYLDAISAFGESIVGSEQAEYEFLLKRNAKFEIYDVDETGAFPILKGRWIE